MPTIFTLKKRLWILCVVLCGLVNLTAQNRAVSQTEETIVFTSETGRHSLLLEQELTSVAFCDLEAGNLYTIWFSTLQSNTDCLMLIAPDGAKIPQPLEHSQKKFSFVASEDCHYFDLYLGDCLEQGRFPAELSIAAQERRSSLSEHLSRAGITTNPGFTPEQLISDIFIGGGCFDVTNVQPIGNQQGMGVFGNGLTSVGIEDGVILASGAIANAEGPNTSTSITTNFGDGSGDPDLNILSGGGNIFDAVGLEFDFTPTVNTIQFRYVFASDEYCDYVNTQFNDVFGFFISGPGIAGGFSGGADNIALVPGTNLDVSINNVNIQNNALYYVDNVPLGQGQQGPFACTADLSQQGAAINDCEYDGFTVVLTATANVVACETYRIRLAVGDVGDGIFDSAVFLEANSFDAGGEVALMVDIPSIQTSGVAYEGCSDGFIIFERPDTDLSQPFTVNFNISPASTATNGTDFSSIPPSVTIPAGQTQVQLPLTIYQDFIAEGTELLILELENPCSCDDATVVIQISDVPPLAIELPDMLLCDPQSVVLNPGPVGGVPGYTYAWDGGSVAPTLTVTPTVGINTYTVTVSDECGNVETTTATIEVGETAIASIEGLIEVCPENPTGSLTVFFTGSGPWDLTYTIDAVPQPTITGITDNPYILPASEVGTYMILSIISGGCPGIPEGIGTVIPTTILLFTQTEDITCGNEFNGSIDLLASGGASGFSYAWSNDTYEEDPDQLGPGVYEVTVTDLNGCTAVTSAEIMASDSVLAVVAEVQGVTCALPNSGAADLTVSGGSPTYTYLWDNGSEEEDPTNLDAGLHFVTVTDAEGCGAIAEVMISEDTELPDPDAIADGVLDCEDGIVLLDGSGSTGTGTLGYVWLDSDDGELGEGIDLEVENPGTYTLVVTNTDNGCSAEVDVVVDQDIAPPIAAIDFTGELNCDIGTINLNGNGSTGNGTLTYTWLDSSDGELGQGIDWEVNDPGTYTLVISDAANGCTDEISVTVDENITPPQALIDPADLLTCEDMAINLSGGNSTGLGSLGYVWEDSDGTELGTGNNVEVEAPGTYSLVITDAANGCTASTDIIVDQDIEDPVPMAEVDGILTCENTMVLLDGSGSTGNGSLTYTWLDEDGGDLGGGTTLEVEDAGVYTLVLTNTTNGCSAEVVANVDENVAFPDPEAIASGSLDCETMMVDLTGSENTGNGTFTYTWLNDLGTELGEGTELEVIDPGAYTLVITNEDNGCSADAIVNVDQDITPPIADAGDDGMLNCDQNEVMLNGTGSSTGTNISYAWLNESNVNIGDELSVSVGEAGTYTLIVTNEDTGCTAEENVAVAADSGLPDPAALVLGTLDCDTELVTLDGSASSATGTITYQWLNPANTEISVLPITDANTPGLYTLIVTNEDNSCTAQTLVEVLENVLDPQAVVADPDLLTCLIENVSLDGSASIAQGVPTYQWLDANGIFISDNPQIQTTDAGTYTLIVTDPENACTQETTVVVNQNIQNPNPDALSDGILTCDDEMVSLSAAGSTGQGNLQLLWLNSANVPQGNEITLDVAAPGTYTLVVTDELNGCSEATTIEVNQDIAPPAPQATVDGILNCLTSTAQLDASGSSAAHPINYQWSDELGDPLTTSSNYEAIAPGTYTVLITDQVNGCTAETSVLVEQDLTAPNPAANASGILTCEFESVELSGGNSTGNGNLTYQWLNNTVEIGMGENIEVAEIGTYTLLITDDSNGCTASVPVEVNEDITPPFADAGPANTLTCDIDFVMLDGGNSSMGNNMTYQWLNAGGVTVSDEITAVVGEAGEYTLVVTNTENGCTNAANVAVVPDANLPLADAGDGGLLTCAITEVVINGGGSSQGMNISYEWFDPNGMSLGNDLNQMVNVPGTYALVVTDTNNGCSTSSSVEVAQNISPPSPNPGESPTLTCEETEALLDASGSTSPLGDLFYAWFDDNGNPLGIEDTLAVNEAGFYTLVVTAENGCTATEDIEVLLDAAVPFADAGDDGLLTCDVESVTLGSNQTSTGPGITHQWQDDLGTVLSNDIFFEVADAGVYTLIVTNSNNNCITQAQAIVGQNIESPQADAGAEGTLTCELTTLLLGGSNTSTGDQFNYEWLDANAVVVGNDLELEVAAPGTYTLIVLNTDNGCTTQAEVMIDQNIATPVSDAGPAGMLTCDVTEVWLDGTGSTGNNLAYAWYNESGAVISNEMQVQVAETGDYTLVVTNTVSGCSHTAATAITPDANLPTAAAVSTGTLTCVVDDVLIDGSASSSISGNLSYSWYNANQDLLGADPQLIVNDPGLYSLVITDTDNGCTTTTLVEVGEDIAVPTVEAGDNDTLTCSLTQLTLSGIAGNGNNFTYQWLDEDNNLIAQTPAVSVSMAGAYTLLVTNTDNGCTNLDNVELIPDTNLPTASAGNDGILNCDIQAILLEASAAGQSGDISYQWEDASGNVLSEDELQLEVGAPGIYTFVVTDNSNNCVSEDEVMVEEDIALPEALVDGLGPIVLNCDINTVVIDGSFSMPFGQVSFDWSSGNGNIITNTTAAQIEVDAVGTYQLTVTNLINGCTDTQTYAISDDLAAPSGFITNPPLLTCNTEEVELLATNTSGAGSFLYDWSAADGTGLVGGAQTLNPTVDQPGTYYLTISNAVNGCDYVTEIIVDEDVAMPVAAANVEDELDCVTEEVQLSGNGSSQGNEYNYQWLGQGIVNGSNTLAPTVNQAGTYTLQITNNNNGCSTSVDVDVIENTGQPTALDLDIRPPFCVGDEAAITVNEVVGGEAPYLYSIDNGENFYDITYFYGLVPGYYDIVVQDAIGCEYGEEIFIPEAESISVDLELDLDIELGDTVQLMADVNVPIWALDTVLWTPGASLSCTDCFDPYAFPTQTTEYKIVVVNENGCLASDKITLRVKKDRGLYIPNVFSPLNDDDINDIFMIFSDGKSVKNISSFQIYDRWGEFVWEDHNFLPDDPAHGWDGTLRGEPLNPAVFVYWARVEYIDGEVILYKGDVTLIR